MHAHFRHLTSHSKNGVTTGFYIAVIGVLLIYLHTQRPVSKYAYAMLSLVAAGGATLQEIIPILQRENGNASCSVSVWHGRRLKKSSSKSPGVFVVRPPVNAAACAAGAALNLPRRCPSRQRSLSSENPKNPSSKTRKSRTILRFSEFC